MNRESNLMGILGDILSYKQLMEKEFILAKNALDVSTSHQQGIFTF